MSKLTLTQLLGEMQGKSMTSGWDAFTLYDQRKANELLFQLYVERFNTDDGYIQPANMQMDWGDGSYKEHLFSLKLSAPRLSFESSDPSMTARARLTMDMVGGMIVSTKRNTGGAVFVSKMRKVLPVGGPQLWMDQPVTKGTVSGLGDVVIDISMADTFKANFVIGDLAQLEVGMRFEEYFNNEVKPEQKIFPLGRLAGDLNGALTPKNFEIRVMKSDPQAVLGDEAYGDGAVMMFITLRDGEDGKDFPNANSTYLIPSDEGGTKYTGAMLLSSRVLFDRIMRGPATSDIGNGITFLDYTPENGGGQDVSWSLRGATGGVEKEFVYDYKVRDDDFDATFRTTLHTRFNIDEGGAALTIKGEGRYIEFSWNKNYKLPFSRVIYWDTGEGWDRGELDFLSTYSVKFDVVLNKETGVVSFNRNTNSSRFLLDMRGYDYLHDIGDVTTYLVPQIKEYFHPYVYEPLKELKTPTLDTFLVRNLLFPGHNALQLTDAFVPGDLAVFGQVDPLRTTTTVSPMNSTIEAGSTLQFTLSPMPSNVQWSVKDVDGNIAQPGVISSAGVYTAPSAGSLADGFVAVMVTAQGTLDGAPVKSSALVSVMHSVIVANPLYASCETGKTMTLTAQSLDQVPLQWSILTPQWGSTVTVDPTDPNQYLYTAGTNMDLDTAFPIDKIEIKNPTTGAVSHITLMIEKVLIPAPMVLASSSDLPGGKAHFQLLGEQGPIVPVPEVITLTWSKLSGNGNFDATTGIYTEPDKVDPGEFVVLSGTADISGVVKFHGQAVIPLPLSKYADLIEAVDHTVRSA
ncbi:hypothetical protein ABH909_003532 [Pseudomonas sp. BS3782 TE3695]|uniref:hypothetical protein n=1 Tax=Pseudomonas sp. BS3782 TE3695 TaxID=3349323 RepID=UPI003D204E60